MGLRCTAFGDDWACRVQRYSNTNDATTHFWFRLNTNTNRFDYVRKIEANTFLMVVVFNVEHSTHEANLIIEHT